MGSRSRSRDSMSKSTRSRSSSRGRRCGSAAVCAPLLLDLLTAVTDQHRRQRSRSPPAPKATVYVSNLTRNVTAEHVREIFGTCCHSRDERRAQPAVVLTPRLCASGFYGTVVSVDLPLDGHVRLPRSPWLETSQ
jgi:hypothetical protein